MNGREAFWTAFMLLALLTAYGYEERVTLADRVQTLERTVEVCCTQSIKPLGIDDDLEVMVRLRQKVDELEAEFGTAGGEIGGAVMDHGRMVEKDGQLFVEVLCHFTPHSGGWHVNLWDEKYRGCSDNYGTWRRIRIPVPDELAEPLAKEPVEIVGNE